LRHPDAVRHRGQHDQAQNEEPEQPDSVHADTF
jgi:hypothetical protein